MRHLKTNRPLNVREWMSGLLFFTHTAACLAEISPYIVGGMVFC